MLIDVDFNTVLQNAAKVFSFERPKWIQMNTVKDNYKFSRCFFCEISKKFSQSFNCLL